jgi:hypothetical protein
MNGTKQLQVHANDVNILGGNIYTIKKNKEALFEGHRDVGHEVNSEKTVYGYGNAGQDHNIMTANIYNHCAQNWTCY